MAIVPLETFRLGETATGVVEYNDANLRISRFYWQNIPAGSVVTVVIWDSESPTHPEPVFNGSFTGDGETPIAGSYRAVTEIDPVDGAEFHAVPPNISVVFSMISL